MIFITTINFLGWLIILMLNYLDKYVIIYMCDNACFNKNVLLYYIG